MSGLDNNIERMAKALRWQYEDKGEDELRRCMNDAMNEEG